MKALLPIYLRTAVNTFELKTNKGTLIRAKTHKSLSCLPKTWLPIGNVKVNVH